MEKLMKIFVLEDGTPFSYNGIFKFTSRDESYITLSWALLLIFLMNSLESNILSLIIGQKNFINFFKTHHQYEP